MTVAMLMQVNPGDPEALKLAHLSVLSPDCCLFVEHRSQRTTFPEQEPPEQMKSPPGTGDSAPVGCIRCAVASSCWL